MSVLIREQEQLNSYLLCLKEEFNYVYIINVQENRSIIESMIKFGSNNLLSYINVYIIIYIII